MDNKSGNKEQHTTSGIWKDLTLLWHNITLKQGLSETRKAIVINEMAESATPRFDFYLMIVLSCTIASLGLVTNSAAVIIGAMLIAPLMSPILGLSMSSLTGRHVLLRRSLIAILTGSVLAILLSALLTFFLYRLPYGIPESLPTEILARTRPSPLDLVIALAGGAAAAYALAHPRLSATLPGVAISTALMPPLCTIGIGLAFSTHSVVLGSSLLFLTNLSAIAFAGVITFAMLGFRPKRAEEQQAKKIPQSILLSALSVITITIPLVILSWNTVSSARLERQVSDVLNTQINNAQIVNVDIQTVDGTQKVIATIRSNRSLSYSEVAGIQSLLAAVTQKPIALEMVVIPVSSLDTLYPPTPTVFIPTASPTVTPFPTATLQPTPTPQPTATPMPAFINTGKTGTLYLLSEPDGSQLFIIPNNSPVWILEEVIADDGIWMRVRDVFDREGWILKEDLILP